ncbi:hypothetical protein SE15_05560 [Thermanaerothrix daxensis]|uniref:DZANK-type domain-containing protein n=1 Tax=Thermanaerothrix daxensis TaxID=869279 RepID=A0A0N8GQS9_9CHLR|nr:zinc ribbon domain-containing protein [Thermanaerothrix daxensis]KPL84546.1 hypothetical protein SE15_05560 [Thermanaerothrix daxensis]
MEQRIYYGPITPEDLANALTARFNRGGFRVTQIGSGPKIALQICTREDISSGGKTAVGISLQRTPKGLIVQVGEQALWNVAASLGVTMLSLLRNPWQLLDRMDDLAQDIESLQLTREIWETIDATARLYGAGERISQALGRLVCEYCRTPNTPDHSHCVACGAPLPGTFSPVCPNCGATLPAHANRCSQCGTQLPAA